MYQRLFICHQPWQRGTSERMPEEASKIISFSVNDVNVDWRKLRENPLNASEGDYLLVAAHQRHQFRIGQPPFNWRD